MNDYERYSLIEKRIYERRMAARTSSFTKNEQFMLAFLFSVPSAFRRSIDQNVHIKSEADFETAMYTAVQLLTNKPVLDTDFQFYALWNSTTNKVDTSDSRNIGYAFIEGYSTPPCPNPGQQDEIVKALLNAPIPG